ncbi:MAG: DUF3887 domain-containing protein [Roseburia sp.]|nr:DUF3887 domain-containing protein [Ruminococcus sp.]MCM1153890.1 DUF3887 domain-containing protein [Roseburia sp.]MCM1241360.1 DUF3887 domain-containing protein [Roseburia sp.]
MDKENYVNQIVKKVKCSKSKKEEIRRQILADISARIAAGEQFSQVVESMGTIEEIAEEFNQNLSPEEIKVYKKSRLLRNLVSALIVLVILCAFVWWWLPKTYEFGHSGKFVKETVEEKVEETILLINADDFEALKAYAEEELQSALTKEAIDEGRAYLGDNWGEMLEIGTVYMAEVEQKGKSYLFTQVHVTYENVKVIYTINFDDKMRLIGIFFQ